jgi:hypothetical protein
MGITLGLRIPLCIPGGIYGGWAGLLSTIILTIEFYQFVFAMAAGYPGVELCAILVIAFAVFILFCVSALLFAKK